MNKSPTAAAEGLFVYLHAYIALPSLMKEGLRGGSFTLWNARLATSQISVIRTRKTMGLISGLSENFFESTRHTPQLGITFIKN